MCMSVYLAKKCHQMFVSPDTTDHYYFSLSVLEALYCAYFLFLSK